MSFFNRFNPSPLSSIRNPISEDQRRQLYLDIINNNFTSVTRVMRDFFKDPNNDTLKDELGNTPLHIAVRSSRKRIIIYLLNNGCDVNLKNYFNETPLDIAIQIGDRDIVELLTSGCNDTRLKNLENDNKCLRREVDTLQTENRNLKRKHDELEYENRISNDSHKRMRVELDNLTRENTNLKRDNEKLQKTVTTLRQSMKK